MKVPAGQTGVSKMVLLPVRQDAASLSDGFGVSKALAFSHSRMLVVVALSVKSMATVSE